MMQLKDTEYELDGSRDRVQLQANEILHKASENNVMTKLHFSSAYDCESLKLQCEVFFFFLERLQFCDSLAGIGLALNFHLNAARFLYLRLSLSYPQVICHKEE